jgi:TatD DNase family protein
MLVDTHCHLTSPGLIEQIDAVLERARAADVQRVVLIAEDPSDARTALGLLDSRPRLYLVAGIHPHRAGQCTPALLEELAAILCGDGLPDHVKTRIVGVGETGLDLHYNFAPQSRQEEVFEAHLSLALQLGRPVVIHARLAEARICDILASYPQLAGRLVFHCFSGDTSLAWRVLDLGGYCSFTGVVTFKKAAMIQQSARHVPRDRLLIETDAPYLSPEPMRKIRPNEPALLVHTARFLADIRGEDFAALAAATTANATRVFSLPEDEL